MVALMAAPQGSGEHLMNLFSFLLPHTRVPGAPHNSDALVRACAWPLVQHRPCLSSCAVVCRPGVANLVLDYGHEGMRH